MTLDPNKPTDQALNSEWPSWIRAIHVAINAIVAGGSQIATRVLSILAGDTSLTVGTDLSALALEVIFVSGTGPSTLETIYGGSQGQIKIFIFSDGNVSVLDGDKIGGQFYLNQLPVYTTFHAQDGDVLALVNVGGNGSTNHGYWKELYRQIAVK